MKRKFKYIILFFALIFEALFLKATADIWLRLMPECYFLKKTGFYCPGCGATRAVVYMVNGRFIKAFMYNPGAVALVLVLVLALAEKITDKKILPQKITFWIVFIVILFCYYILRNFTSYLSAL